MRLLIKNGNIVNAKGINGKNDILIEDSRIKGISLSIDAADAEIIDAAGLSVFPGLVDMHCHLRDPGQEYKEDIASGTRAAAAGGFTSIACMPNTLPVNDNKTVTSYIRTRAAEVGAVRVYPIGSITKGMKGEELTEMQSLKEAGAVAVSDDGKPVRSPLLMKHAMQYAAMFSLPVISHCEDLELAAGGLMNEGTNSTLFGLRGIPSAAEELMVSREVILAQYTKTPVHIAHVSTALSVELIRQAKKRGAPVTAETCPHYFALTDDACTGFDTNAKVNPPLRTAADVAAVIEGLRDGTIDAIATDHAPHHADEKCLEFANAPSGLVGFETALALSVTYLLKPGHLSESQLAGKLCAAPAEILGLPAGKIAEGENADITIIDTGAVWTVDPSRFHSKSKNTPFGGMKLFGLARYTIVGGRLAAKDGRALV